ncbi:MAG: response regulator transcription factor [Thermoanaerobaculia bacterium]
MKLLIVDDNARVRRLIADFVAPVAAEVIECTDGTESLRAYQTHRPDAVLMDVAMRERDGIAATLEITAAHPAARVVIVTDYDDADLRDAAQAAGARAYVLKENLFELPGVLDRVIRERR